MNNEIITPLMQQYHSIKSNYPEALLLFQVGDFYELFFEDAQKASLFLGIALTKRGTNKGEPIPLCGVPVHALDHYLHKLVKGGFCVALCNQLELPQPGRVVKRGVTQVLTPGTLTDTKLLDEKSASYLFSFAECNGQWGLLFGELLTAQLYATVIPAGSHKILESELNRFFPDEVVLSNTASDKNFQSYFKKQGYFTSCVADDNSMAEWAQERLAAQSFEKIKQSEALSQALTLLYGYVKRTNQAALSTFHQIYFYQPDDFLVLDAATQRNLELLTNLQDGGRANTLLAVLDRAVTPMGSRTLKKWLVRPLVNKKMIEHRLEAVEFLKNNYRVMSTLQKALQGLGDGERIVGRIALRRGLVQDYLHLARILATIPALKSLLEDGTPPLLTLLGHSLVECTPLRAVLDAALNEDMQSAEIIKKGFSVQLEYLREIVHNTHAALLALEQKEQAATGIASLKVRFNNVQGYYIEITNPNAHLVPEARYKRRQTLANRERYTCSELQQLENDITTAHSQIGALEQELFEHVKDQVAPYLNDIRKMMHAIAQCDTLLAFAVCAYERGYVRPEFTDSRDIIIVQGKHPVVEQKLGSRFVPNNTTLTSEESLWVITGPNMGGKSTYLRQVAQLCIMAQCGSFIPAHAAKLPLLDRVFTRIGASDNVAEGKSTFLVEMEETAHICQFATEKSLVILDEVGRGTSTFDGLAIAQAVIEYLFVRTKARCLFATHYHELTKLQDTFPGIVSYFAASSPSPEGIVFLHTMVRGVADGSFGLEVAKLAHLPASIIERARSLEKELSSGGADSHSIKTEKKSPVHESADADNARTHLILAQLTDIDYENLSPKKAFDLLWQIKERYLHNKNA